MLKYLYSKFYKLGIKNYIDNYISRDINDRLNSLDMARLVNDSGYPIAMPFIYLPQYNSHNEKCIMEEFAKQRISEIEAKPLNYDSFPHNVGLKSSLTKQSDLEADWARYWLNELHNKYRYHRKNWEYAFVLQALFEHGMFGKRGLGMACGNEKIPSFLIGRGCQIVAGDKPLDSQTVSDASWRTTKQYTESKDSLFYSEFIDRSTFERNLELRYIDMNNLPIAFP